MTIKQRFIGPVDDIGRDLVTADDAAEVRELIGASSSQVEDYFDASSVLRVDPDYAGGDSDGTIMRPFVSLSALIAANPTGLQVVRCDNNGSIGVAGTLAVGASRLWLDAPFSSIGSLSIDSNNYIRAKSATTITTTGATTTPKVLWLDTIGDINATAGVTVVDVRIVSGDVTVSAGATLYIREDCLVSGTITNNGTLVWGLGASQSDRLARIGGSTAAQGALADTAVQPGDIGTAAALDTGTAEGQIPVLGSGGKLPAVDGSLLTGIATTDWVAPVAKLETNLLTNFLNDSIVDAVALGEFIDGAAWSFQIDNAATKTNAIWDPVTGAYVPGTNLYENDCTTTTGVTINNTDTGATIATTYERHSVFQLTTGSNATSETNVQFPLTDHASGVAYYSIRFHATALSEASTGDYIVVQIVPNAAKTKLAQSPYFAANSSFMRNGDWNNLVCKIDMDAETYSWYLNGSLYNSGTLSTGSYGGNIFSVFLTDVGTGNPNRLVMVDYVSVDKIDTSLDMDLRGTTVTAEAAPSDARVVVLADVNSGTLNTDLIASVSRDGGTSWTAVTLADEGDYVDYQILTGTADISGQPSGTSMQWKVVTDNGADVSVNGVGLNWE